MRRSRPPLSILLLTVFGFCSLYAPQPLLPVLAEEFGRSPAQASLLITVTMLPLAFAPLVYGYVLEAIPARRMLVTAALILAVCQAGLAIADAWWMLILLRVAEGLALPALFTALMTFVANTVPETRVRHALAWYISATIVGGFSGRAISGVVGELWNWRIALGIWAPVLLILALTVSRMPASQQTRFARITPDVFRQVLHIPGVGLSYLAILCVFFVFAAALNVLPFRDQRHLYCRLLLRRRLGLMASDRAVPAQRLDSLSCLPRSRDCHRSREPLGRVEAGSASLRVKHTARRSPLVVER